MSLICYMGQLRHLSKHTTLYLHFSLLHWTMRQEMLRLVKYLIFQSQYRYCHVPLRQQGNGCDQLQRTLCPQSVPIYNMISPTWSNVVPLAHFLPLLSFQILSWPMIV